MPKFPSRERSWPYIKDLIEQNGLQGEFVLKRHEYNGASRTALFNSKGHLIARIGREAERSILTHIEQRAKRSA